MKTVGGCPTTAFPSIEGMNGFHCGYAGGKSVKSDQTRSAEALISIRVSRRYIAS